jgi:aminopeptidase N/puromycin-sensitive aminopeptidase
MTRSLSIHSLFIAGVASALCLLAPGGVTSANAQRLSTTVIPHHYALTLTPDLQAATFTGLEAIDVVLQLPSTSITLNSLEIAYQSVTVTSAGKLQTATVSLDPQKEQATFTFPEALPAGPAALSIQYTGILNSQLRGFYLSKTARRNYGVTQFESTDARRAFPSFDEPAFKASFDVTLIVDAADAAISNSPIASDTPGPGGKHTISFATTPKMSTYLVAFLVGDFQCTSGTQDTVAIRVCSTPDKVGLTSYALDVAKYVLHYYNNYFGIPYPLKKLDLIGLPDFEAGAMENFGAITFRETDLLIDPKTASLGTRETAASVVAHEMAHQWFGDLVTMQWWDNIWLNEGFATWMANKPLAAMHPEWNIDQSVISSVDGALNLDAQPSTHAIRARADTRDEIEQMFDGISYGKASDVLLMVENYVGEETFRKGVHAYLSAHLYSNATAEDFWSAQTQISHKPVDKIMESFVVQPGEPILTFAEPAGGKVDIAQHRFYLSPSIASDAAQKWTVPVCFKTGPGSQDCRLLTPSDSSLSLPPAPFLFADAGGTGFYRSAYPAKAYADLVARAETGLTPAERITLIGDEWGQLRSGKASIGDFLNLVAALKADPNAQVLSTSVSRFETAYVRIAATPQEKAALQAWVRTTFAPAYNALGPATSTDSPNTRFLRSQLFTLLGVYGKDPRLLAQAREITQHYLADPTSVDPTLRETALELAAENGDSALFDQLQKIFLTSLSPELQVGALHLLAQFQDPSLVQRSLDYAVSGNVRNQDAAVQLIIALSNDETRDLAWTFIQTHWEKVQPLLTPESGTGLVSATAFFCSAPSRDSVEQFFAAHKVAASGTSLKQSIERINNCIEFRALQEPNLKTWLATHAAP